MKEKYLKILFALVFVAIAVAFVGKKIYLASEYGITREIAKANFCTASKDCTVGYYGCPFGCISYINKSYSDYLTTLTSREKTCAYKCEELDFFDKNSVCIHNRCVASNINNIFDATDCSKIRSYINAQASLQLNNCAKNGMDSTCEDLQQNYPEFKGDTSEANIVFSPPYYSEFKNLISEYKLHCSKK